MEASLAWSEWPVLKHHPWEWFVTLTFPWQESKERAEKAWRAFSNKLARLYMSSKQSKRVGLPLVGVVEQHLNGSYHIHTLISGSTRNDIETVWTDLISPKALTDIKEYKPDLKTIKYMVKDGSDLMLSNWFSQSTCVRAANTGKSKGQTEDVRKEAVKDPRLDVLFPEFPEFL
jgi:hypothetical protein